MASELCSIHSVEGRTQRLDVYKDTHTPQPHPVTITSKVLQPSIKFKNTIYLLPTGVRMHSLPGKKSNWQLTPLNCYLN